LRWAWRNYSLGYLLLL